MGPAFGEIPSAIYLARMESSLEIPTSAIHPTSALHGSHAKTESTPAGALISTRATAYVVSQWTNSVWKRLFDIFASVSLLTVLSPVFLLLTGLVRLSSVGPAIYRQERVGRNGKRFVIFKFRTMVHGPDAGYGTKRTTHCDKRITRLGAFLRRFKLDEIPQLINILRGDMSLVGPRPMVPEHQSGYLSCRPGLTGVAALAFAAEEELLAHLPEHLVEHYHAYLITPHKVALERRYLCQATFVSDVRVLLRTARHKASCYRRIQDVEMANREFVFEEMQRRTHPRPSRSESSIPVPIPAEDSRPRASLKRLA